MEWTETNNKATINELLDYYADLIAEYRDFAVQNLDAGLPIKLKALQEFKSVATTIELLLKRWAFAYLGYDGNSYQARADADAAVAEQASLTDSEIEDDFDDELKITLREVPEIAENGHPMDAENGHPMDAENGHPMDAENGHPMDAEPLASTQDPRGPQSKKPVKKTKAEGVAAIFDVLEAGEQRTAAIADAIGCSERSVRRHLKALIAEDKVSKVKRGVYRLHRSVKWTETDNQVLINTLLGIYTALIDACKGDIKEIFASQGISTTEKMQHVKTFNTCVTTIDRLMKRWSLVHHGWHANPGLAKADAAAKTAHTEKVNLASAPLESFFLVAGRYHSSMRELMENMPFPDPPVPPPNDETGTWVYDATTQELFAPWEREPLSEAEARRRLMKRKSTSPAGLLLFGDP